MDVGVSISGMVMNELDFEQMGKRFGHGIIPTIGFLNHALDKAVALEVLTKSGAGILDASIGVDHQAPIRLPVLPARSRRQAQKISRETLISLDHYGRKLFLTCHTCKKWPL